MPKYQKGLSRSNYYGVTGIIDVLSSVKIEEASSKNLIIKYLQKDSEYKERIENINSPEYEIIVDYKGMKRPPVNSHSWNHHQWQILTYSWLRSMQPESRPVLTGILFYLNELSLFKEDLKLLKMEVQDRSTDIMPSENDLNNLLKWNIKSKAPDLSLAFKNERSIRFIMTENESINNSLNEFDQVVAEIENSIICEVHGKGIKSSWIPNPEKRTCDACDFKTFCAKSESTKNVLTVP